MLLMGVVISIHGCVRALPAVTVARRYGMVLAIRSTDIVVLLEPIQLSLLNDISENFVRAYALVPD